MRRRLENIFARSLGLMLAAFLLTGCGSDTLPDYVRLGPFRVLAVPLGTAGGVSEAAPGETVTLTPWISWVDSGGSGTVSWSTTACRDPGIAYGAEPSCEGAQDRVEIGAGQGGSGSVAISSIGGAGSGAEAAWTGPLPAPVSVTVPADFFTRPLPPISVADQQRGWSYLVVLRVNAGEESVTTVKRIVVTTRTGAALNTNPSLDAILGDGVPLTVFPADPGAQIALSASFSGIQEGVEPPEEPTVTWFFSDGEYERFRTTADEAENGWTPPAEKPASRGVVIVAVLRDGRGGESIARVAL